MSPPLMHMFSFYWKMSEDHWKISKSCKKVFISIYNAIELYRFPSWDK